MIEIEQAKKIVQNRLYDGMMIAKIEDYNDYYIFHCKNSCRNIIPDKVICALNKDNGNIGFSIISIDDAIASQSSRG